jgi:phosphonate transport system ATP-binding protein
VLKDVSLCAVAGQITMIVGPSGSGKTSLLKLAKGLLRTQRGTIAVMGAPLARFSVRDSLDPRVAYIPQQLGLVRNLTVLDNVLSGALARVDPARSLLKLFPTSCVDEARATIDSLGIGHKVNEKLYALSGGERQRVAIARALMQQPRLILADEFISQLDRVTSIDIMRIMQGIAESGVAVVVTTHELEIVGRSSDRVVVLRNGEKVLDTDAASVGIDILETAIRG